MAEFKMVENAEQQTCSIHKKRMKAVNISPGLQREKRILCEFCTRNVQPSENLIGLDLIILQIENKLKNNREELYNNVNYIIKKIEELKGKCDSIKQFMLSKFDTIASTLETWEIQSYDVKKKISEYSLFEEVQQIVDKKENSFNNKSFIDQISFNNQSFHKKIMNKLEEPSNFQEMNIIFNEILNLDYSGCYKKRNIRIEESKITVQQIGHIVEQKEQCKAVVFNHQGTIMVSTLDSQIRVWGFQKGVLKLVQTLNSHEKSVQCLFFSKLNNYFISSSDQTIKLWILVDRWICQQTVKLDKGCITCIITDLKENLIIFGSTDYSIQVWEHNHANNLIKKCDLIKHDRQVISLSLNLSEALLVSCAEDSAEDRNQIIVWGKTSSQNNPFEFKYFVRQIFKISGPQVKFINDEQFVLISYDNNMVSLFEDCLGELLQNYSKNVELLNIGNPERLFPISYNPQKQLLYFKVNSCIYILNSNLQLQTYISSNGKNLYGSVTNDGQYFVYWDGKNRGYSIFKILYL